MRTRTVILVVALLVPLIPLSLGVVLVRHYANTHYRPPDLRDISFDTSDDTIVFNAVGMGGRDLFLLRLSDSRVTRIAETPDYESDPSFSPDEQSIVYAAGVPGDRADHIFVRSLDGTQVTQLTRADANDESPRISPDGSLVVFVRKKTHNWGGLGGSWGGPIVICLIGMDGSNERQLTADEIMSSGPEFSSDGRSVLYATEGMIFSVPVDGSSPPTKLAGTSTRYAVPSPNDRFVVYTRGQFSGSQDLLIANADGTDERVVMKNGGYSQPQLTPSEDRLFFFEEAWPDGGFGHAVFSLWEIGVDGQNRNQVAPSMLFSQPLEWKPPGKKAEQ